MINRRHVLAVGAAAAVAPSVARAEGDGAFDAALTAAFDTVKPVALAGGVVTDAGLVWS
ncbi:MAG TPA: serine hydrolase, partial [Brevundimonas sp.]|nr:serine hydrolase [Brevundimonas sp.]